MEILQYVSQTGNKYSQIWALNPGSSSHQSKLFSCQEGIPEHWKSSFMMEKINGEFQVPNTWIVDKEVCPWILKGLNY